ncbi:MAG: hypothetical protein V4685_06940 [Bacteroidota bacterium]
MIKAVVVIIILCIPSVSCLQEKKESFYCDISREGVWRLPIVYPIEFVTSDTTDTWNLISLDKTNTDLWQYSADSINYHDGKIVVYTDKGNVFNLGIIDLKNGALLEFKTRKDFYEYEKTNLQLHTLHKLNDVFLKYKNSGGKSLPWINEIKEFSNCSY